jgi:plasmid stabilization system protein ParE
MKKGFRVSKSGSTWINAVAHKLRFHAAIPDDLIKAFDYYDEVSLRLADRFRKGVDQRLNDIAKNPEVFPFDISPIRFAKIDRFPYLIIFTLASNLIYILAIVHGASDSSKWRDRTSERD